MKKIILASESPRRKQLLLQIGIKAVIEPAALDESAIRPCDGRKMAFELSRRKAEIIAAKHRNAVVIGADTVGILGDKVLGKPHTVIQAKLMLASLSGRSHVVVTAFTIIDTETKYTVTESVETTVFIKKMDASDIDAYVGTGEPLDKAGGYAIQGLGALIVDKIEGDYFNVVGLPLRKLAESLKQFGLNVWDA